MNSYRLRSSRNTRDEAVRESVDIFNDINRDTVDLFGGEKTLKSILYLDSYRHSNLPGAKHRFPIEVMGENLRLDQKSAKDAMGSYHSEYKSRRTITTEK